MQLTETLTLLATSVALFAGSALGAPVVDVVDAAGHPGHYSNNCQSIELVDSHLGQHAAQLRLQARCYPELPVIKGSPAVDCLDLNKCYGYTGGAIVPQDSGNFGDSCQNCALVSTTVLSCDCLDPSGNGYTTSQIDTDKLIWNEDGAMTCFGTRGTLSECPAVR